MRREHRLRRESDFERVRANRKSWAHPFLVCYVGPRDEPGATRVGVVVSRRVGNAVVRNRVKRRIRESVRGNYDQLRPDYDVVLIARPSAVDASLRDIDVAIDSLFNRARLWKPRDTSAAPVPAAERPSLA